MARTAPNQQPLGPLKFLPAGAQTQKSRKMSIKNYSNYSLVLWLKDNVPENREMDLAGQTK